MNVERRERLGCWHFWRRGGRKLQLYTNACRPCRAKVARRLAKGAPVTERRATYSLDDVAAEFGVDMEQNP